MSLKNSRKREINPTGKNLAECYGLVLQRWRDENHLSIGEVCKKLWSDYEYCDIAAQKQYRSNWEKYEYRGVASVRSMGYISHQLGLNFSALSEEAYKLWKQGGFTS